LSLIKPLQKKALQNNPQSTKGETLSNSLYEFNITLIPKLVKDTTKKENYRPTSPFNVDAQILKKETHQIQHHI
jgi:hypothetical protein